MNYYKRKPNQTKQKQNKILAQKTSATASSVNL